MDNRDLFIAIGELDDLTLERSEAFPESGRKRNTFRWLTAAVACLLIAAVAAGPLLKGITWKADPGLDTSIDDVLLGWIPIIEYGEKQYEVFSDKSIMARFGLPEELTAADAGAHIAHLNASGEADRRGYSFSEVPAEAELLEYKGAPGQAVYVLRDGEKYFAAVFNSFCTENADEARDISELYEVYGIDGPEDIASLAQTDWQIKKVTHKEITDRKKIEDFYTLSLGLEGYGNQTFQQKQFGSVPEEQAEKAYNAFADDLHVLRVETVSGLRFYLDIHPSSGWINGRGAMTYYFMDSAMDGWVKSVIK